MKSIELTQGKIALVDDADFESLNQFKWSALKSKGHWYASRNPKGTRIYMHKEILGLSGRQVVDHRDGDGLNNQRFNLRDAGYSGNAQNRVKFRMNRFGRLPTTPFKGVFKIKGTNRFRVRFERFKFFQDFDCPVEAAKKYDEKAKEFFGEFALTNHDMGLV